ncbi:formyltetrahydrofolate deformylase [Arenibacter algicola]|uniref:formyltetrahydrofolate deformylase n=1 Tax=Arenibacter algicola TaxID=616991 RepID=UPI001C074816|nr:formyltetrahydrofolate deformylase [Arenibacter algicola]MBU2903613.1 formyltetrahydrofolate deformylase [Arenibacter algicola]
MNPQVVTFLIKCPDQKGIIAKLTGFFYKEGFNIISSQQYTNSQEKKFFMRIRLASDSTVVLSKAELENRFETLAKSYEITWKIDYGSKKQKVAIMVSHTSHNLYDLLQRHKEQKLSCEVVVVVSNHLKLKPVADMFGIPFHYAPVTNETKVEQEEELIELFNSYKIDLIVMARYMQILTANFISHFPERIINIHHSFLPAFQGANPYKRAYERGVKLIGATAHYATENLDEGPIIEQDVERISHESTTSSLKDLGADIETLVLSRAVNFHLNDQIIVDGNKAIVFPETGE